MAELIFVAYDGSDVHGDSLGVLTDAADKQLGLEDNAVGNGSFTIHPNSSEVNYAATGNYIRVWRDFPSGDPLGGFWLESGGDIVLSASEEGGEENKRYGRGPIAILDEVIVWHKAKSGTTTNVDRSKGRWVWKDSHPARVLVRLLEEAKYRGGIPDVTWDFTRKRDSDGVAFADEEAERFEVPIGATLLDVVGLLRDTGLHITMDADLVLHAWDEYENDLSASIAFNEGIDIRESSERQIMARQAKSHVVVQGTNRDELTRYRTVWDSGIKTSLGRRKEGFYRFERTANSKTLQRVGARKLRKWKKQYDGPITLGTLDKTGQVAGIDFTVGDTVNIVIPGIYDNVAERVAGITFAETDAGDYDVIIDFGDFAHDPVSGAYLGGDSSGLNPCGCAGGADGGAGGSGTYTPPVGVPGSTPVSQGEFVLDDFNRSSGTIEYADTSGLSSPSEALSGFGLPKQMHELPLPDGARDTGDVLAMFGTLSSQIDGGAPSLAYDPIVGLAPVIVATQFSKQTDVYADEIVIPLPDGMKPGMTVFVHTVYVTVSGTIGNTYDWSGAGWSGDWGFSAGGLPSMSECVPLREIDGTEGFSGVNDSVLLDDMAAPLHANVDAFWSFAFLVDGPAHMGTPDDDVGWNGAFSGDDSGNESLDPKTGWTNWTNNDDLALYLAAAFSSEAILGEFVNLDTVKDDSQGSLDGGSLAYYMKWALAYERSDTFATGGGLTMGTGTNDSTRIFAIRGGPAWTGYEGHTNISYAPTMHRFRILDGTENYTGDGDVVHVWLDPQGGTYDDLEPDIAYATLLVVGAADYEEGSDLLFGNTNEMYYRDMIGPSPDNGDYLYFGWATRGGEGAWVTGDVGTWSSPGPSDFIPLQPGFDILKVQNERVGAIAPHSLVVFRSGSNQFEYDFATRYAIGSAFGGSPLEDGSTISTGATGGGLLTGAGGGDGTGIGSILTTEQNGGSPWPGGNPWSHVIDAQIDDWGVDGSALYFEADEVGSVFEVSIDADDGSLPMQNDDYEIDIRYRLTTAPTVESGNLAALQFSWAGEPDVDAQWTVALTWADDPGG